MDANPAGSSGCKRKQPDPEEVYSRDGPLREQYIENEYEHIDDDDDVEVEEDSGRKRNLYNQILGAQEPATIKRYDSITITPFNLHEELEEGNIDEAGNFIFAKESEKDHWAESIDWLTVEKDQEKRELLVAQKAKKEEIPPEPIPDRLTCFKKMLRIMRPDETVQKAIRRLGNDVPKRRSTKSKLSQNMESGDEEQIAESKRKLDLMIELAHRRLEDGDTDIYQKSYEDLEESIN